MPQAVKEHYIHVQVNVHQFKLELNNESMPHRALRGLSTKFHIISNLISKLPRFAQHFFVSIFDF